MRFRVEHLLRGTTVAAYEQLYFDAAFNTALCAAVGLRREVVSEERGSQRLQRAVRVRADRVLPAVAQKLLKTERIEYTEHLDYAWGSYRAAWRTVPSLPPALADKIRAEGTMVIAPAPEGVRRIVEGVIDVSVFGVGPVIEKLVVADLEESYERAAQFTQRWLAGRG